MKGGGRPQLEDQVISRSNVAGGSSRAVPYNSPILESGTFDISTSNSVQRLYNTLLYMVIHILYCRWNIACYGICHIHLKIVAEVSLHTNFGVIVPNQKTDRLHYCELPPNMALGRAHVLTL